MKRGDAAKSSHKRALSGPRAVAIGAVLYTAVRAAFAGARSIRADKAATDGSNAHTGEFARSKTRRSRPERMRARENDLRPSLTLPNRRWAGMAAKRR